MAIIVALIFLTSGLAARHLTLGFVSLWSLLCFLPALGGLVLGPIDALTALWSGLALALGLQTGWALGLVAESLFAPKSAN